MASVFKNSPKWIKRAEVFFAQSDMNKNNRLSIEDFELWVENIKKEVVNADPILIEKVRAATLKFWEEASGLKPGVQLTIDQFLDEMAKFAAGEGVDHKLFYDMLDAFFDVADTNRDGFLQLDEYEKVLKAGNFDADAAKIAFDIIDTNHDGKLSREELKYYNFIFWFTTDNEESTGIYGAKFE